MESWYYDTDDKTVEYDGTDVGIVFDLSELKKVLKKIENHSE